MSVSSPFCFTIRFIGLCNRPSNSDFSPSITQVEIKGKRKIKNDTIKLIKYHLKLKNYINEIKYDVKI